jgi:hypothetical protein
MAGAGRIVVRWAGKVAEAWQWWRDTCHCQVPCRFANAARRRRYFVDLFQNSIWNLSAELNKIGVTGEIGFGGAVEADDIPPIDRLRTHELRASAGSAAVGYSVVGYSVVGHCKAKVCIVVLQEP